MLIAAAGDASGKNTIEVAAAKSHLGRFISCTRQQMVKFSIPYSRFFTVLALFHYFQVIKLPILQS
jgi:hypothetical protein